MLPAALAAPFTGRDVAFGQKARAGLGITFVGFRLQGQFPNRA